MKIIYKNTTKYDSENRNNFINFHNEKYGKKEFLQLILISICVIYILIFNIIYNKWYFIIGILLICGLLYLISKQKKEKKKQKQKNKDFTFFFYERYIKVKYKREFERINYFEIKKIFETEKNFFLYTDERHSLILDKDGFTVGNPEGFAEFIKKKCPFRYSSKKSK